jgi:hypothetical protein
MYTLLVVTALLEGMTGLVLVVLPSPLATLLLGASLDAPAALTLARVAGMALIALALTCWLSRHDGQSRAARGLVAATALYHACAIDSTTSRRRMLLDVSPPENLPSFIRTPSSSEDRECCPRS